MDVSYIKQFNMAEATAITSTVEAKENLPDSVLMNETTCRNICRQGWHEKNVKIGTKIMREYFNINIYLCDKVPDDHFI